MQNLGSQCCSPTKTHMGPTLECCLGVVVVQYPGVQVYNNYPFKSSEQPVSFALTGTNTHPSTLPVIRTIRVCLCHFVLSFLFQMVSTSQAACPTGAHPVLARARMGSTGQNSPTGPSLGPRWAGHLKNKTMYFRTLFNVSCSPLEISQIRWVELH